MEAAVDTAGAELAPSGAAARARASRVEGAPPAGRADRDELTQRIGNQTVPGRVPVTEGDAEAGSCRLRSLTGREGVRSSHRVPATIAGIIDMSPASEGEPNMFSIIGFVWTIVIGAIIGALARLLLREQQNISLLWTTVLGIVGAFIGDSAARSLGVAVTPGIDWIRWGLSIVAAMIAISIYVRLTGKK